MRGFERGADDYVAKPFSYGELRARVAALLRRAGGGRATGRLRVGTLEIDPPSREVRLRGERVELSQKEFALLRTLAAEPTRVFTKEELLRDVWGFRSLGATRTLDSHACRLRQKLGAHGDRYVVNVWGVGYRLVDGPVEEPRPRCAPGDGGGCAALTAPRGPGATRRAGCGASRSCARAARCGAAGARRRAAHELARAAQAALLALHGARRRRAAARGGSPRSTSSCAARALALDDLEAARGGPARGRPARRVDVGALLAGARRGLAAAGAAPAAPSCASRRPRRGFLVRGDPLRLAQAVGNLLANAIEHGGGRVQLRVRATAARVRIEVRDEGPACRRPLPADLRAPRAPAAAGAGSRSRPGSPRATAAASLTAPSPGRLRRPRAPGPTRARRRGRAAARGRGGALPARAP